MDKLERTYLLHHFLNARHYPASIKIIYEALRCSKASAYRYINELQDEFGAPIERSQEGFRYPAGHTFELPGLWFSNKNCTQLSSRK